MRIYWRGKSQPASLPPGLIKVGDRIYQHAESCVCRELGGTDPRWSLNPHQSIIAEPEPKGEIKRATPPPAEAPTGPTEDEDAEED